MNSALSGSGRDWLARIAWLIFAALLCLLALYWLKFAYNGWLTANFPGEIDYGEGIVWQQTRLIPGPRMYGDLGTYPFIVFHYPPVYHLTVHALAALGTPWLTAGRLVSTLSTFALGALITAFTYESLSGARMDRRSRIAGALVAGLVLVTFSPIQGWAYKFRVDMLAMALEFLGMYLGLRSLRQPGLIYASAAIFVLTLFTKQTMLAGAVSTLAVLLIRQPGRAVRAAIFAAVLGGGVFALLTLITHGGFPRHTILYNVGNPFTFKAVYLGLVDSKISIYPVSMILAFGAAIALALRVFGRPLRETPAGTLIILAYFALATLNLLSLGKSGASDNYLIPWTCSWALLSGLAIAEAAAMAQRRQHPAILLALSAALLLQALATPKFGIQKVVDPEFRREYTQLIAQVREAKKPVLSEDMVLLMQAGKNVPWEPTIIADLSRKGLFDERKTIGMIAARDFAFVVLQKFNYRGERFTPETEAAIAKAYPVEHTLARLRVLSPAP